jgi:gluconate 2-dehydrogenase gamma chain
MAPIDRRDFLRVAGGAGAALWLAQWPAVEAAAAAASEQARLPLERASFETLTAAQAQTIDAFASRIIPTDDLPGALEAGAVHFIDRAIGGFAADMKAPVMALVAALDAAAATRGGALATRAPDVQDAVLRDVEASHADAFGAGRFLVICGTFANSSYGGNRDEAGWKILGFEHRPVWQKPYGWYDAPENIGRE